MCLSPKSLRKHPDDYIANCQDDDVRRREQQADEMLAIALAQGG